MASFSITGTSPKRSATGNVDAKDKKSGTGTKAAATEPTNLIQDATAVTTRPLSPVTNQAYNTKDARAYEHARQRSKHAQEFAKKRAKKEEKAEQRRNAAVVARDPANGKNGATAPAAGHSKIMSSGGGGGGAARMVTSADVEVDEDEILMAPIERGPSGGKLWSSTMRLQPPLSPPPSLARSQDSGMRVNLADLIVVSDKKPRKSGVRHADDFEVVPHVKAVIALDDVEDLDMELDEPWEHVQADDGKGRARFKGRKEPSYANIVAGIATPIGID